MIIALVNQKGGVGKTTTTINVGACLASEGKKVLIVDLDPQSNATSGLGVASDHFTYGLYHVLTQQSKISEAILHNDRYGYDLLPASSDLAAAVVELVDVEDREYRLRAILQDVQRHYDVILIDCPPSLGLLTINGLVAATGILIPVQCEYYALEGLGQLLNTIDLITTNLHPDLTILGAVVTMFDRRNMLAHQVLADMRKNFPGRVFDSVIPRNVRLAEAPSHGKSIVHYDPSSKGAIAYRRLAGEIHQLL